MNNPEFNIQLPKTLSDWDFPDTELLPDGYDMTSAPKMSDRNFRILVEEHNKVVEVLNALAKTALRL